ncbi:Membrane bound L-sorbosone dehydrogenase [Serratia ficaria]|nr:Membrane bound L-sorbosone dehydrogenase [Serratia ficaria]
MKITTMAIAISATLMLAGCDNKAAIDPERQIGPDPELPAAQNFLMPPMQVPKGVGWQADQMPKVAADLKIEKVADGLLHPRQLLTLPNGDILVVESNGPGTEAVTTPNS